MPVDVPKTLDVGDVKLDVGEKVWNAVTVLVPTGGGVVCDGYIVVVATTLVIRLAAGEL